MPKQRTTVYIDKDIFAITIGTKLYSKSDLQTPYLRQYFQQGSVKYELDMGTVVNLFSADPKYRTWSVTRGDTLVEENIYTLFEVRNLLLIGLPIFLNQELTSPVNFHFYVDRMTVYVVNGKVANFESAFVENDPRLNNKAKIWIGEYEDGESIVLYTDCLIDQLVIGVRMFSDEGLQFSPEINSFIIGSYVYLFSVNMISAILNKISLNPTNDIPYKIFYGWSDEIPERAFYLSTDSNNKTIYDDKELSTPFFQTVNSESEIIVINFLDGGELKGTTLTIDQENEITEYGDIINAVDNYEENAREFTDSITNETKFIGDDGYIYNDPYLTSKTLGAISISAPNGLRYYINQQPNQPPPFTNSIDQIPDWSNAYEDQLDENGDSAYYKYLNKRVNWYENLPLVQRNEPHWDARINGRSVGDPSNQAYWKQYPPVTINGQNYGGNG